MPITNKKQKWWKSVMCEQIIGLISLGIQFLSTLINLPSIKYFIFHMQNWRILLKLSEKAAFLVVFCIIFSNVSLQTFHFISNLFIGSYIGLAFSCVFILSQNKQENKVNDSRSKLTMNMSYKCIYQSLNFMLKIV